MNMVNSKLVLESLEKNQLDIQTLHDCTKVFRDQVICYGIIHPKEYSDAETEKLLQNAEQMVELSKKIHMRAKSIKNIFTEKTKSVM